MRQFSKAIFITLFLVNLCPPLLASDLPDKEATCEVLLENQALTQMVHVNLAQLKKYPGQWAMASSQIMIQLMDHLQYTHMDFAYFEKLFRRDGIPLYLVANSQELPMGLAIDYPPPLKAMNKVPPRFYLWTGVRGKEEADRLKTELGVTDEQNLENLRQTGVLIKLDPKDN